MELTIDQAVELLEKSEYVAVDTEATGLNVRDGRDYCIGISIAGSYAGVLVYDYFPLRHSTGDNLHDRDRIRLIEAIENFQGHLIFHNAKYDLVSLKTAGIDYTGKFYDTMLMCHLINENYPFEKGLTACAKVYLGKEESKKDDASFELATKVFGWDMPVDLMKEYAAWDAALTFRLYEAIKDAFYQEVNPAYWEHKQDFIRTIIYMERNGVMIDPQKCHRMIAIGEDSMEDIREELGLNPGSSNDLHTLLIERLKLPVVKTTPTGKPSFNKQAMEQYETILENQDKKEAELILAYRGWQQTISLYYRAYLEFVSPDGRLRPNYKLHGTKTGRLACAQPNLQQIPKSSDKEWNGDLKSAFIPTPGYKLYEADYSQLELRLAAAYAKEKKLLDVFEEGRDIFTEMSKTLGMTRFDTKSLTYTIQYGGGVNRLVQVFGVSPQRAGEIRENFYRTYPGIRQVSNLAKNKCLTEGKVKHWAGRYRHFHNKYEESHKAFNSVMQGGAADIVEHAMVRFHKQIADDNCRMLLQVHDSVIFELKEGEEDNYFPRIRKVMTEFEPDFGVKFAVDIHELGG